jgi:signal transduction histidine kinase
MATGTATAEETRGACVAGGRRRVWSLEEADCLGNPKAPPLGPGATALLVEVAHDLRSPLTAILCLAGALRGGAGGELNAGQRRQLGLIYSAALGLSASADNLVEMARAAGRTGGGPAGEEPAAMSIGEVLGTVADIVRPMAEEKELEIRVGWTVNDVRLGHRQALQRVLLNLSCNALKFTDHGYVEITACRRGRARVEFAVRDTGPGFSLDAVRDLPGPAGGAARVGGRRARPGLGLAICSRLVAQMGAQLQVETADGWGTRFHFQLELPLAAPSAVRETGGPRGRGRGVAGQGGHSNAPAQDGTPARDRPAAGARPADGLGSPAR